MFNYEISKERIARLQAQSQQDRLIQQTRQAQNQEHDTRTLGWLRRLVGRKPMLRKELNPGLQCIVPEGRQ